MMRFGFFECDFCQTRYQKETTLTSHKCEKRDRHELMKTGKGMVLFNCYKTYHRALDHTAPLKEHFINSKYYTAIERFVDYSRTMMIPDRDGYIRFAVSLKMHPPLWSRDDVYELYIQAFDDRYTPLKQVEISLKTIVGLARYVECKPREIWDYMKLGDVMKYIGAKKLSPWLLFYSDSFQSFLKKCTQSERMRFETVVDKRKWMGRFRADPETVKKVILSVRQLKV